MSLESSSKSSTLSSKKPNFSKDSLPKKTPWRMVIVVIIIVIAFIIVIVIILILLTQNSSTNCTSNNCRNSLRKMITGKCQECAFSETKNTEIDF